MKSSPFYDRDDLPTTLEKKVMWKRIDRNLTITRSELPVIKFHIPSFIMGSVASLLLLFSVLGVYSLYTIIGSQNQNEIDRAYEEALTTMSNVSHELIDAAPAHKRPLLEAKQSTMEEIDLAIQEIRSDILLNGNTEFKQRQLRQLYAMKLDYMKELLLKGEKDV
jgi:hypothetical protein